MKQDFIRDNPQIIQALRQAREDRIEAMLEAAKTCTYEPSEKARRNMEQLIQAQRKPYYKLTNTRPKKTLLALAAVLLIMITMVFSVSALREPLLRFIVETYEKFSAVFFVPEEGSAPLPDTIETQQFPHWMPEGYTPDDTQEMISDTQAIHFIISNHSDPILYQQYTLTTSGFTINTEGITTERVQVGAFTGIYYSNLGSQTVIWEDGQYGFSLSGPINKRDLLLMANSVKEK